MPAGVRVYINERGCTLPPGARVRDALAATVPDLLSACESGGALVTDGRGLPVGLDAQVSGGTILRVRGSGHRGSAPADA